MAIIKIRNAAIDLDAAEIPNLPASKITSGTLDNARISLDAAEIPNLDTAKITTGTLADARVPNLNASKITAGTITDSRLPANALNSNVSVPNQSAFKNIIINGDMSIAQRGTSTSGITSNGYYTADRMNIINEGIGTFTVSQSTDVPSGQGFAKSMKFDCTTANASPSSGFLGVGQSIEGQNLQYLKKGTSNAESLTLSFWIKSNKTGTYVVELYDPDNNRTIAQSYTISSASTWEKKTLTYAGDTTGALDNDNNNSLRVNILFGAGTEYTSGSLQTSWGSRSNTRRAVGQVNLADNTSNELYITGVQLEAGTASDFEFLPVDVNFTRCQRYCQFIGKGSTSIENIVMSGYTSTLAYGLVALPTKMRTAPSLTYTTTNLSLYNNGSGRTISNQNTSVLNHSSVGLQIGGSGWSAGQALHLVNSDATNGLCKLDAEL